MRTQSYRTIGFVLMFVAVATALIVQFLGGGLVAVVDAHEMTTGPGGSGGGFVVSMVLRPRWLAAVPVVLGLAGIVFLFIRGHEQSNR